MKNPSKWLENTLSQLQELVITERRIGVEILELLWEIERRKSYSELGYDGMYSFCLRELKFTESQAYHRLQTMRALKMNSEKVGEAIKSKIESGSMSMSTVAQVQVFLRKEQVQGVKRSETEKLVIFNQFENKTALEVKKGIAALRGERIKTKLVIELDEETEFMWNEFKAKAAFQTKGDELLQLKILLKESLKNRETKPVKKSRGVSTSTWVKKNAIFVSVPNLKSEIWANGAIGPNRVSHPSRAIIPWPTIHSKTRSRYVPVHVKREVFRRDQNQCAQCGSKYAISIEHQVPFAQGGNHSLQNLKLLCRNCNLHQGVKQFGLETMRR